MSERVRGEKKEGDARIGARRVPSAFQLDTIPARSKQINYFSPLSLVRLSFVLRFPAQGLNK